MAISSHVYQWISQQGLLRFIDASSGPQGVNGVTSYWLVPAGGYIAGQRVPHDHQVELEGEKFNKQTIEGIEYFLIPEESTNLPGRLSHYAERTGVADLANPPGGGVNRVRETLTDYSAATVDPEGVAKYVADNDSFEEARTKATQEQEIKDRAVSVTPAREPSNGDLVVTDAAPADNTSSASKAPAKDSSPKA